MKNAFVLATLVLASFSLAQAPAQAPVQTSDPTQEVYVTGHYTKSGKWIDGYYRKRPTKRGGAGPTSKAVESPAQTPPLPDVSVPKPGNSVPTLGHEDFVPSHVTKSGKFVPGHFKKTSHRMRPVRSRVEYPYKTPVKRSHTRKSNGLFGG